MQTRALVVMSVVAIALGALSTPAQEGQPSQAEMQQFMQAMGAIMSQGTNQAALVDFRELKAMLPPALDGLKRTGASGERTGAMGMSISFAEGTYEADSGARVEIKISDNGGIGGFMQFAQAAWANAEIDRETDTGFERTTTYGAHKAHEEYDNEAKSGEVQILVGGRFSVEVKGNDVSWEALQAAVKKLDLDKLATLKPKAAAAAPATAK